jgi:hypothetical protein
MANIVGFYQFDPEGWSVAMVTKEFWDVNQALDHDCSEEPFVPEGFFRLAEAVYEHEFDDADAAKQVLNKAGWVEKELFPDL